MVTRVKGKNTEKVQMRGGMKREDISTTTKKMASSHQEFTSLSGGVSVSNNL